MRKYEQHDVYESSQVRHSAKPCLDWFHAVCEMHVFMFRHQQYTGGQLQAWTGQETIHISSQQH